MTATGFYALALVVIAADAITKAAVSASVPEGASVPVLGSLLSITPTRNTGGAFSLMQGRNDLFIACASVAVVALVYAYHRYQQTLLWPSAALSLALGGAIGNLADRLRFGHVRDYFDVHVWPIFNIADAAITCAVVILLVHAVVAREPAPAASQPERPAE
ncbi:MAG TPA: signal peptidase II [Chthonomonadales bacterium]|nr:signal peptidase II [Chthonomonadales bacterium]